MSGGSDFLGIRDPRPRGPKQPISFIFLRFSLDLGSRNVKHIDFPGVFFGFGVHTCQKARFSLRFLGVRGPNMSKSFIFLMFSLDLGSRNVKKLDFLVVFFGFGVHTCQKALFSWCFLGVRGHNM